MFLRSREPMVQPESFSSARADSPQSEGIPSIGSMEESTDGSDSSSLECRSPTSSFDELKPTKKTSAPPAQTRTPLSALIHGSVCAPPSASGVVGIPQPSYKVNEEFLPIKNSAETNPSTKKKRDPTRIGITPSKYERPDFPLSPQNLFLIHHARMMEQKQQEYVSPAPVYFLAESPRRRRGPAPIIEEDEAEADDGIERTLHEQTASGHFLVSDKRVLTPPEGLRFDLTKNRAEIHTTPDKLASQMAELEVSSMGSNASTSCSVSTLSSNASSIQACTTPYKIFCLLLHPTAKIFELIQVVYSPDETTIGDLLHLIPENASEKALGLQEYVGFCRPKDLGVVMPQQPLCNSELMASPGDHGEESGGIRCGEILVPVPQGYTGAQMAPISRTILKNPQILKLLNKSNPLSFSSADDFELRSTTSKMFISSPSNMQEEQENPALRRRSKRKKKKRKHKRRRKTNRKGTATAAGTDEINSSSLSSTTGAPETARASRDSQQCASSQAAMVNSPPTMPCTVSTTHVEEQGSETQDGKRKRKRQEKRKGINRAFSIFKPLRFGSLRSQKAT